MVQIRKVLMQTMWKKSTIALIAHRLGELVPNLCQIICWGRYNLPSLTASVAPMINVDDMNGADLQSTNAANVKIINNHIDCIQTRWACSPSVPDYLLRWWNLPSLMASVSAIIDVDDMNGTDSKSAYAEDVKTITIALIPHILSELALHLHLCQIIC